jgi:hypothetical protein
MATFLRDIVPKRFPLLRAKMERIDNPYRRKLNAFLRSHPQTKVMDITDEMIVNEFADFQASALTWNNARVVVGPEHGVTDEAGHPVNARARRLLERGRKAHSAARRDHLQDEKRKRELGLA